MIVRGRCWKLGDSISTDHIISGKYKFEAINDLEKMAIHVLEEVVPGFYEKVLPGDIIVAGRNFGKGSSREHAPRLLKLVGVGAVVAESFAHIFYRNAINVGLPVVVARVIPRCTETGDLVEIDLEGGYVRNITKKMEEKFKPFPPEVLLILTSGGIVKYVKKYGALPWRGATK